MNRQSRGNLARGAVETECAAPSAYDKYVRWMMRQSFPVGTQDTEDQFGKKRMIPRNFGRTIKIPRLKKQNIIGGITEGIVSTVPICPISGEFISGTMSQFAGAYKHSDLLIMTALSDVVELSLRDIARDVAKKIDVTIRDAISGTGVHQGGNAGPSNIISTNLRTTSILKVKDIISAVIKLRKANNPTPPDGFFPCVVRPETVYDLQTSLSTGAWLNSVGSR